MSWQQGENNNNPSNWRQLSSEEGEIGEEEGEIIPNDSGSVSTNISNTTAMNQPPLPPGGGADNNPKNIPCSNNPSNNNPINSPNPGSNPNPRGGGGGPPFPPRRQWGPRPGRGGPFRGRGGMNRHSFSAPPPPGPTPMPVRSQSFSGYPHGGRGGGPPTAPLNRPTDPRFRGSSVTGPPDESSSAGPPPPVGRTGSFSADRLGPPLGAQQQQHPHHQGPPPLTSSYSSLAEPTTHVDSSDTHGGSSNFPPNRGPNIFRSSSVSTDGPHPPVGGGRSDSSRGFPSHQQQGPPDGPASSAAAHTGAFVGGRPPRGKEFPGRGSLVEHRSDSYRSLEGGDSGSFPPPHHHRRDSFQRNEGPSSNFGRGEEFGPDGFGGGRGGPPPAHHGKRDSFRSMPPQGPHDQQQHQPPLHPDTDAFRPRDGGFHQRRDNDFRGAGGGRGDGGPSPFRGGDGGGGGYYGSNEFRRSPSQRGRPMIAGGRGAGPPPPIMARSFSQGGFGGRRNDPRLGNASGMGDDGPGGADGASLMENDGSNFSPDTRQHQSTSSAHGPMGKAPDAFGRSREWGQPSLSPQGSPQSRKPITSFLPTPSPPMDRKKRLGPGMQEAVASMEPAVKEDENKTMPEEENRLRTPALGNDVSRAENVIGLLANFLNDTNLKKAETDEHSFLPTKQLILDAIEKMDTKIKETQKELVEKQEEFDEKISEEKRAKLLAEEKVRAEAKLKEEEEQREEEDRRQKEDKARGAIVQKIFDERKRVFLDEEKKVENDLDERLRLAKQDEEKRLRIELEQQISLTNTAFDKDIAKARKDLDLAIQNASKVEAKLYEAELDYQNKLLSRESDRESDDTLHPSDTVANIISENRRRAAQAHLSMFVVVSDDDETTVAVKKELETARDPVFGKTSAQWAKEAQNVTGIADALYSEPDETPYFDQNEKTHAAIAYLVKEYVRDKKDRLNKHWTELAEEAEFRRKAYEKQQKEAAKIAKQKHVFPARTSVIARTVMPVLESTGGRSSNNPYRRARRGNEVRSEYEQEQIIAEIAAKEAMEKRIAFGGCPLPRQVGWLEKKLSANFVNTFTSQRIDPVEIERDFAISNVWTDVEKCIFLDRFLQHPKDFKKIASFLRNKATQDCVAFYYDSKHSIPYKGALKEHIMRRKRRGDYHVWDATIQAAISVGAIIQAGHNEEKPLVFYLPEHDFTYNTRNLHPMKQEILNSMTVDEEEAVSFLDDTSEDSKRAARPSRKRKQYTLFTLDPEQRKFLRPESPDPPSEPILKKSQSRSSVGESSDATFGDRDDQPTARKAPQKWTAAEKKIFKETLEEHGRNWTMLQEAVGTKTIGQIKNYYYDFKKAGKNRSEKKSSRSDRAAREGKRDGATTPPPTHSRDIFSPQATPINGPSAEEILLSPWVQQVQQQQQQQQPFSPASYHSSGTMELIAAHARQLELERGRPRSGSGSSTPDDISDLWAHAQAQQAILSQEDAARRLLQHHSHAHHQQVLSNLMPWLSTSHHQSQLGHTSMQDWTENQQLEALLRLQQQQQQHHHHNNNQQQEQQTHQEVLASLGGSLNHLSLAGLTGLSASLAHLEEQQRSHPQQQHNQQQQQQQHSQQGSAEAQLALVQQLLALQQVGNSEGGSIADALNLLARMGGGHNHQG